MTVSKGEFVDAAGRGIYVLHVDDDEGFSALTKEYLEHTRETLTVVSVTSPAAALEVLDRERVDCVVSDYEMPGMDGLEFFDGVRARRPNVPFILFSGTDVNTLLAEPALAEVTAFVEKRPGGEQYERLSARIEDVVRGP